MHHSTQVQNLVGAVVRGIQGNVPGGDGTTLGGVAEMHLYTRYEHGNMPVRVFRDGSGGTRYGVTHPGGKELVYRSARQLVASLYGHDVHMPFDRYFRLGKYRRAGRASGQADLLTLLDPDQDTQVHSTPVIVHGTGLASPRATQTRVMREPEGSSKSPDPDIVEFTEAMKGDLQPLSGFAEPTGEVLEEFDRAFGLELDRIEGTVGIDLGELSKRGGSKFKADEVRRLLWRGFAGKMLSQGYDPEDVVQEVYRGLLVRNKGKCPWDARKSTFGHYVHMVISCVLTNYHRKQARRIDKDAAPLDVGRDGEDRLTDVGQYGSCPIEHGSELGDMLALEQLEAYLGRLPDDAPEATLGREILPMVASGHQRGEIVRQTGRRPSLVSRALAWLRRQTALWATEFGMARDVPDKYLLTPSC